MKAISRIICPITNRPVVPADCLFCQDPCMPRSLIFSFLERSMNLNERYKIIGVTESIDCLHRVFYKRTTEVQDFSTKAFSRMIFGTGFHSVSELAPKESIIWSELPIIRKIDGTDWHLFGIIDAYDPLTGILWDIKTTTRRIKNDLPLEQHKRQLWLYYYLVKDLLRINELRIVYFYRDSTMSEVIRTFTVPHEDYQKEIERLYSTLEILDNALEANDPQLLPAPEFSYKCYDCPFRGICPVKEPPPPNVASLDKFMGGRSHEV